MVSSTSQLTKLLVLESSIPKSCIGCPHPVAADNHAVLTAPLSDADPSRIGVSGETDSALLLCGLRWKHLILSAKGGSCVMTPFACVKRRRSVSNISTHQMLRGRAPQRL